MTTDDQVLTIELEGREQLWALRSKVLIRRKDIISVSYENMFNDWRKWEVRMPGASVPGKLIAGSFWTEQGWDFLYLTNPHKWLKPTAHGVLCIVTNQQKFKRIIVSCAKDEAILIKNWAI